MCTCFTTGANCVREDPSGQVLKEVSSERADLGIGGIYATPERISLWHLSTPHSHDCASFVSLASTALPK